MLTWRRVLLALLLTACEDTTPHPSSDASLDAMPDVGDVDGAQSSLCDELIPSSTWHRAELAALCVALATHGTPCPQDRRDLLLQLGAGCSSGRTPTLRRRCGIDLVEDGAQAWGFDSQSGELRGVSFVTRDEFECGPGFYLGGQDPRTPCSESSPDCELCKSEPEREENCPPEVVKVLPGASCKLPAEPPGCSCEDLAGAFAGLPTAGALCGAAAGCDDCQSGTCWAHCACTIDGTFRWQVECTE